MISIDSKEKIKNIVIFVSDALRYDFTPEEVTRMGIKTKMIASSIFTAPSFPSMFSGLYPNNHKVYSFTGPSINSNIQSLMNLKGYYTSLWTENSWLGLKEKSPLHRITRSANHIPLTSIKEPFIYVEDEKGGHCPYGWPVINSKYEEWDCKSFYEDYSKKSIAELKESYQIGVDRSVNIFKKRLETLAERGIEEETLVIFTSDHGELLGEYGGLIGHSLLTVPELVYVPLIFINPQLPTNINLESRGVARHVDMFPTICDILNINMQGKRLDGKSLYEKSRLPNFGFSFYNEIPKLEGFKKNLSYDLKEIGFWSENRGFVLRKNVSFIKRLMRSLMLNKFKKEENNVVYRKNIFKNKGFLYKLKKDLEAINMLSSKTLTFGEVPNVESIREILKDIPI